MPPTGTRSHACSSWPGTRWSASTTSTTAVARLSGFARRSKRHGAASKPPEDGYQGAYVAELAQADGDPVQAMVDRITSTLERFRVHFDHFQLERELESEIPEAIALLDTYEAEGTVWARTSAYGDDRRTGCHRAVRGRELPLLRLRRRLPSPQARARRAGGLRARSRPSRLRQAG